MTGAFPRGVALPAIGIALIAGVVLGYWFAPAAPAAAPAGTGERPILYWVAPMDPNYRRDAPGKSPMGMDLVPVYADAAPAPAAGVVTIDPAVLQNLGLRSAAAQLGPLPRRIETVGYVQYDESVMHHIHTRVEGWIESLHVRAAGDPVAKGQLLFEIYSPTLVNAQREYLTALSGGRADMVVASRERLAALGMPQAEIAALDEAKTPRQRVRIYAPADGVTTQLGVREGIFVTPAAHVISMADLSRVWVLAEVFERQTAWVAVGQRAEVELDYLPGRRWHGTVDYVYPDLHPVTRTLRVRIGFDNAGEALRPNMFARVVLLGGATEPVVHIPREALIRGGAADRVALDLGGGRFRAVAVEAGVEAGERVEIRSGLKAGEQVVVSGQFLIDSESNLESAMARTAGGAPPAAAGHGGH